MIKETTFGLIVGTRGFFSSALALEGRRQLMEKLDCLGYKYVILPEAATPTGAVETIADAQKCAKLFHDHADEISGVIVSLPNFGDELGVVNTLKLARLDVPVLVQACDDDLDKLDVAHRRDAFCGKLSVCNNLYQYGIPFTDTSLHTCAIMSDAFAQDIDFFARVCRVVNGVSTARLGNIGARPSPFQTMRVSEKLLQATGATVVTVDLSEIIFGAQKLAADNPAVRRKLDEIHAYGTIADYIPDDQVLRQACLSVVIDKWMADNAIDAAGVQCWESIETNYGCAVCLSMSMCGEKLQPCACEVDVAGALGMYALTLASGNPSALLDWNNNYGSQRDKCACTHCSNYPRSFIGAPIEISQLDVLGESLGRDRSFGAIKGKVAPGPMTYFRISTDDPLGTVKAYLGEGDFTDDPFDMAGGIAVAQIPNLQGLMKHICRNGFEHHVGMVRSHCAGVVAEAVETYLDWDLYYHKG